jgi:hypothetical protein
VTCKSIYKACMVTDCMHSILGCQQIKHLLMPSPTL